MSEPFRDACGDLLAVGDLVVDVDWPDEDIFLVLRVIKDYAYPRSGLAQLVSPHIMVWKSSQFLKRLSSGSRQKEKDSEQK